jgi:predicted Zn finger-like uncharacterized protein
MKFVCDKCHTKYSIADDKVRRKVLKIRCKNCGFIIVVREPAGEPELGTPERPPPASRPLAQAFDGAFKRPHRPSSGSPSLRAAAAPAQVSDPELDEEIPAEATRLSSLPPFLEQQEPGGIVEDEWFLAVDGNQFGPMGFSELCSRVKRGETGSEAYVWRDGFDEWLEISEVPELKPYLPRHPPPPPRARSGLFPTVPMAPPVIVPVPVPHRPQVPHIPPLPPVAPSLIPSAPSPAYIPGLSAQQMPQASPVVRAAPTMVPTAPPIAQTITPLPLPPAFVNAAGSQDLPLAVVPGDSGLRPLPPIETREPLDEPARRPSSGTPLVMKIAAGAGIVAALCGVALMIYFFFVDRGKEPPRPVAHAVPADPAPPRPAAQPDAGTASKISVDFPPMEIERSKEHPARVAKGHKPAKVTKVAAAPATPELTDEQKRLKRLYGKEDTPPSVTPKTTQAQPRVARRQLSTNEILSMQKKHSAEFKACYERALKRDDSLAELKLEVSLTIADSGLVKAINVKGSNDTDLVKCITRSLRHWAFEPIGEVQEYKLPIVFRGS